MAFSAMHMTRWRLHPGPPSISTAARNAASIAAAPPMSAFMPAGHTRWCERQGGIYWGRLGFTPGGVGFTLGGVGVTHPGAWTLHPGAWVVHTRGASFKHPGAWVVHTQGREFRTRGHIFYTRRPPPHTSEPARSTPVGIQNLHPRAHVSYLGACVSHTQGHGPHTRRPAPGMVPPTLRLSPPVSYTMPLPTHATLRAARPFAPTEQAHHGLEAQSVQIINKSA
eukprot:1175832-Prorocentrum_minimum.AAC.5